MGCETVVPSSFSLSIALPQLEMLILRHFYTVIPPLRPAKHRATPPRKDPILFLFFLAPFYPVWNLSVHCEKIVLYCILFQPHPICGIGKYQSASNDIRSWSQRKSLFFLLPFVSSTTFSLSVSLGVHMHRPWFQSRAVPLLRDHRNGAGRWRHPFTLEGVFFLLDQQRLIFRGRCLLNYMNWRTSIASVSSLERQFAPQ